MKNLILIVLGLLFCSLARGQSLPEVVDNSEYFPPLEFEAGRSRIHVNYVYLLKSSIWNRKYDRNPDLAENQFSYEFIGRQVSDPINLSEIFIFEGVEMMKKLGCVTMADMPENYQYHGDDIDMPSAQLREKALSYKTKALHEVPIGMYASPTPEQRMETFNALKDSLINGSCFMIRFSVYEDFSASLESDSVYDHNLQSGNYGIGFMTIVGYDDKIETLNGNGAFIALYPGAGLKSFYFDYDWFTEAEEDYVCYFLEEDFNSNPELAMHMTLTGSLDNLSDNYGTLPFTDTIISRGPFLPTVDFNSFMPDYAMYKSIATVVEVNGQRLPLREKQVILPTSNGSGDFELTSDLTDIVSASNFDSIKVLVLDPANAYYHYSEQMVEVKYEYYKPEKAKVQSAYINFLGSDKKVIGRVTELEDTIVRFYDYESYSAGYIGRWSKPRVEVDSSIITLRRQIISFSASDVIDNEPPFFTMRPEKGMTARVGNILEIQFEATDPDGDEIVYSLLQEKDNLHIDANTGLFTFTPDSIGYQFFSVVASDGIFSVLSEFKFAVLAAENQVPFFAREPEEESVKIDPGQSYSFSFYLHDYDRGYDLPQYYVQQLEVEGVNYAINEITGFFTFSSEKEGEFEVTVLGVSQGDTVYSGFTIVVDNPSGTFEIVSEIKDINIYPNPVTEDMNIEILSKQQGTLLLELCDVFGRIIDTRVFNNLRAGKNSLKYQASELKSGLYFCRFRIDNESPKTLKIYKR